MDSGIRSGQDVLKAWALGARGTMIGRAMVYGLGAMGEAGVTQGAADHPQGTRRDDGLLRPHEHRQRRPRHPAAGHLPDLMHYGILAIAASISLAVKARIERVRMLP